MKSILLWMWKQTCDGVRIVIILLEKSLIAY